MTGVQDTGATHAVDLEALVITAESPESSPPAVRAALDRLVVEAPGIAAATALGILSRAPRIKPSRNLLIDPANATERRWRQRVAAAAALLASPAGLTVADELLDELSECRDLALDALAQADPCPGFRDDRRAARVLGG
jgi:hypothetical protein